MKLKMSCIGNYGVKEINLFFFLKSLERKCYEKICHEKQKNFTIAKKKKEKKKVCSGGVI